jgi:tetratricopeptide (TPR) repeat protein
VLAACATVSEERVNRAEAHRQLAELRLAKREIELAMREYQKSIELYNRDPEAHFGLSQTYRLKGMLDLAERHLLETLRLDPKHQEARLNLGAVYLEWERWEDAIRENDILIEDPTFLGRARALVNRGWAHYKSGNAEQAERDFRNALTEGGFNDYAHMNLGILYYSRGEVVESIRELQQVLEILGRRPPQVFGASEAEARFWLARAYVKLGQRQEAIEHLKIAAERGGEGKWGRKSREYLAVLE